MPVISPAGVSADAIFADEDFSPDNIPVIAAVSGGGDSLALLFLLHERLMARGQAGRLRAVTVDHALRAEAADEAAYVARLCARHGIIHRTMRWEGAKPKTGIQAAARSARYRLLAEAAADFASQIHERTAFICTAHTMGDQAETYLMRSARMRRQEAGRSDSSDRGINNVAGRSGSSDREENNLAGRSDSSVIAEGAAAAEKTLAPEYDIAARGLAGMARLSLLYQRFWLMRPLLDIKRADLRAYLRQRGIKWIDDPGNDNPHYERVRIRQNMTAEQMAQCAAAAEEAAKARQILSAASAEWGKKLDLRAERQDKGAALILNLAALQNQGEAALSGIDFAALYLLLAYVAAICGGKAYISAHDARLEQFLPRLCYSGKGEKPRRISVSGAVLEKRKDIVTIRCECRNFPKTDNIGNRADENPFATAVPQWDALPYALFAPLLPVFGGQPQADIPAPPAWGGSLPKAV